MTEANVVNIVGGLGNQLFQYLFGLALEKQSGRPTLYDVSDFAHYKLHGGLAIDRYFALTLSVASDAAASSRRNVLSVQTGLRAPRKGATFETMRLRL